MFAKAFNINVLQGKVKGVTLRHREKPLNLIIGFMKKTMLTLGGLFCVALLSAQEYQKTDHGIRTTVNGVDVEVQYFSPRVVRVVKMPAGKSVDKQSLAVVAKPGEVSFKTSTKDGNIVLDSKMLDVTLNAEYVVPDSLAFVSEVLAASPMVEEVDSQQPLVAILNENLAKISAVFGVFILLLLFISFVLINNMVRLSVFARRFTIHTMKLVGATKAFIRAPFLRGALVQGLISAFLASAAIWGIYYAARSSFSELFEIFDIVTLLESTGIIFVCGVLICVLSTYFVVGRLVSANKDELYY